VKKTGGIFGSIGLLALAAIFLWVPHYMQRPGPASHKILAATDKLSGTPFEKAVIFVLNEDGYGATGLMLNRPLNAVAFTGGPLEPTVIYTLHSLDLSSKATVKMPELEIGYTKGETFAMMVPHMGDRPKEHMVFSGYTGWSRGQLQEEIAAGKWKVAQPTVGFIFHTNPADMWNATDKMAQVK
jgi:putative transcriptional regulator